jgi:hypothetical protein
LEWLVTGCQLSDWRHLEKGLSIPLAEAVGAKPENTTFTKMPIVMANNS